MKVLIYTFEAPVTLYVAKQLIDKGGISGVILQKPMTRRDKIRLIKRRVKSYGLRKVLDEMGFKVYYNVFLQKKDELARRVFFPEEFFDTKLNGKNVEVYKIDSINSDEGKKLLRQLKPDLIIMESREMIDRDVLKIPRIGFVGCHPGIIPEYRGVYASFWAMRFGEPDKVGLSVYLADAGIDTGGIISQRASAPKFSIGQFKVESERLMVEGVEDLYNAVELARQGTIKGYKRDASKSRFFSHIGFTDYLKAIFKRGKHSG